MDLNAISSSVSYQAGWLCAAAEAGGDRTARFVEKDTNGDGGLDVDEIGFAQEMFDKLDTDGDGLLTDAELLSLMPSPRMPGNNPADMLAEKDANGDGGLDIEESGLAEKLFTKLDIDADGLLTEADMPPPTGGVGGGGGPAPADMLAELDSDGDGQLTVGEAGQSEEEFDTLDTNKDGLVSQAELEAAWASGLVSPTGMDQAAENKGFGNSYAMAAYEAQMKQDIASLAQAGYVEDFLGSLNLTA